MIELTLTLPQTKIPVQYKYPLQAYIYKMTDAKFRWHEKGYIKNKFKPLSVSDPIGEARYLKKEQELVFNDGLEFVIRSPIEEYIEYLAEQISKVGKVKLFQYDVEIEQIKLNEERKVKGNRIFARTLSPICIMKEVPNKPMHYKGYEDVNETWASRIFNRLAYEYEILTGEKIEPSGSFGFLSEPKRKMYKYMNCHVLGFHGDILLQADNRLLQLAVNKGIGSCQPKGFGMIEDFRECDRRWTLSSHF